MHILSAIEQHLKETGISATRFGRTVARDPRFVFDLRLGREPREPMAARVARYLAAQGR